MGMFDTMQQGGNKVLSAVGGMGSPMGAVNGTSAQKASSGSQHMRGRGMSPASSGQKNVQAGVDSGFGQPKPVGNMQKPNNNWGQMVGNAASQFMQNRPGAGGSNSMLQAKQQALQAQQAQGGLGPSDPVQQLQQTLAKQKGLQSPYDSQQANQLQAQQEAVQGNPMQAASEQMQGYNGPDLGSQDPRELARMGQANPMQGMNQLYGSAPMMQNPPFQGGGNPSFQTMMQGAEIARPDVMPRGGIGPSFMEQAAPMQMDENGLEPRRGAR